jgi:hypothetical protein
MNLKFYNVQSVNEKYHNAKDNCEQESTNPAKRMHANKVGICLTMMTTEAMAV